MRLLLLFRLFYLNFLNILFNQLRGVFFLVFILLLSLEKISLVSAYSFCLTFLFIILKICFTVLLEFCLEVHRSINERGEPRWPFWPWPRSRVGLVAAFQLLTQ
ncbi:hypothetical protein BY996DRAFT_4352873 [Phakopsora pachyrhizi]|uniref:Expressed protein n=1 Tax=Phakopsora pachyrhizi TaxID=170000 RepID=A0AAV0AY87_PHAPC|nr:hypothetical protein BY996DRAFT_4352873 [Phakopsora pachyrhizi]CAH7673034.1 expressed protein [Phakopsora pachyrhizi]